MHRFSATIVDQHSKKLLDRYRLILPDFFHGPEHVRELLATRTGPTEDFGAPPCIHQLFEKKAQQSPGAAAVESDGKTLSYAELNARANQLAHRLQALGVVSGPKDGLFMPDSDTQRAFEAGTARLSSGAAATVGQSIAELRASLAGLQLAFDLADRLPPEAVRGPVLDVLRDRVQKALSATEALDGGLVAQGAPDRRSTRRAGSRRASPARTH